MKSRRLHYSWLLVIVSSGIAFINSIVPFTFGVFLKPLAAEFQTGRAIISGARSLNGVLSGLLGIGIGRLNDRYGPRILVTLNGILIGLGLLLMSRAGSIWQTYLFYGVIIALGISCFQIPIYSTIPRWFDRRRETALGIIQATFGLGGMTMTPLIQWLVSSYGWRPSYLIAAILTLVFIIPIAQFMKQSPDRIGLKPYGQEINHEERSPKATNAGGITFSKAIRTRGFWLFGLILLFFRFCLAVVTTHIVAYATDIEIGATAAASIIVFFSGSGIFGKLSMGFVSDKIGTRLTLTLYLTVVTLSFLVLLFAKELWTLYIFAIIFGIGYGGVITLPAGVSSQLFGLKYLSTIFAGVHFFGTIGMALGPVIAGGLYDVKGNYTLAFLICLISSALSVLLSLVLLRYKAHSNHG